MGIHADTWEDNAESNYDAFGYAGAQHIIDDFKHHQSVYAFAKERYSHLKTDYRETTSQMASDETQEYVRRLTIQKDALLHAAKALYEARTKSIARERMALFIMNHCNLSSHIVCEDMNVLLHRIQAAFTITTELIDGLDEDIKSVLTTLNIHLDDAREKERMIDAIMLQVYRYISDESRVIHRSDFRLIESDCANILRLLDPQAQSKDRAEVFSEYCFRKFAVHKSNITCPVCRRYLYTTIPNCLFCYERK